MHHSDEKANSNATVVLRVPGRVISSTMPFFFYASLRHSCCILQILHLHQVSDKYMVVDHLVDSEPGRRLERI